MPAALCWWAKKKNIIIINLICFNHKLHSLLSPNRKKYPVYNIRQNMYLAYSVRLKFDRDRIKRFWAPESSLVVPLPC